MKKYDRLIFVSNSDTCRGPMAEAILKSKFLLSELEVESEDLSCSFGAGQSESRSNPGKPRADHERSYGEDAGTGRF